MWLLFARAPAPAIANWPGRRVLAVVDALAWPALVAFGLSAVTVPHGLIGDVAIATCSVLAVRRAWTATFATWRYRLTTWRWGAPSVTLLAVGVAMKLAA
jgi:hypothetical protein